MAAKDDTGKKNLPPARVKELSREDILRFLAIYYYMGLVQLRQSANSFLQMRTHTADNSAQRARADAMYKALIEFIQNGPNNDGSGPGE